MVTQNRSSFGTKAMRAFGAIDRISKDVNDKIGEMPAKPLSRIGRFGFRPARALRIRRL